MSDIDDTISGSEEIISDSDESISDSDQNMSDLNEKVGYGLSLPLLGTFPIGVDEDRWKSNTITVREIAMLWFVNTITDKPEWWRKVHDEGIVAKWKAELDGFVAQGGEPLQNGFSDEMFDFCMKELRDKASIYETTTTNGDQGGIVSVIDTAAAVFKADGRVPPELVQALRDATKPFEDVPADEKDWHPGSNEQVLDLVHPSLWPLVYGTSRQLQKEVGAEEALAYVGSGETVPVPKAGDLGLMNCRQRLWSNRFQWLPAEVSFGADGKGPAEIQSYINNAHPVENRALYPVIAQLVDLSLPMLSAAYQRVMQWTECFSPTEVFTERKRITCNDSSRKCTVPDYCGNYCNNYKMPESEVPEGVTDEDDGYWELVDEWFNRTHPVMQPEPNAYAFPGVPTFQKEGPWFPAESRRMVGPMSPEEIAKVQAEEKERTNKWRFQIDAMCKLGEKDEVQAARADIRAGVAAEAAEAAAAAAAVEGKDHRLQVIVKLANIHLTPENPRYAGGAWHFEGQLNERICATALYYYDCENVTESRLAFRTLSDAEGFDEGEFEYDQGDHKPFEILYGMNPGMDMTTRAQRIGDVVTKEGRLLVFPNVLQHQVQPFELADKTRPGHRKIVALFLVDPQVRIPSTATIPPQQAHWREASAVDMLLPPEISEIVYQHLDVPYRLDTAKKLRAELIDERKAVESTVEDVVNEQTWSFCEH